MSYSSKPADVLDTFSAGVKKKPNETFDHMLKRFKKSVQNEGVLQELRKREYYVAPSLKARLKHQAAVRAINRKNKKKVELY